MCYVFRFFSGEHPQAMQSAGYLCDCLSFHTLLFILIILHLPRPILHLPTHLSASSASSSSQSTNRILLISNQKISQNIPKVPDRRVPHVHVTDVSVHVSDLHLRRKKETSTPRERKSFERKSTCTVYTVKEKETKKETSSDHYNEDLKNTILIAINQIKTYMCYFVLTKWLKNFCRFFDGGISIECELLQT